MNEERSGKITKAILNEIVDLYLGDRSLDGESLNSMIEHYPVATMQIIRACDLTTGKLRAILEKSPISARTLKTMINQSDIKGFE